MPGLVFSAHPRNKEKSYRHFLEKLASDLWSVQLCNELSPGRLWTYVNLHFRPSADTYSNLPPNSELISPTN